MEITEELKVKALACNTAEELLALAKENGIELAPEEAELILQGAAEAPEGELTDGELEDVAGGAKGCKRNCYETVYYKSCEDVEYIFSIGQVLQVFIGRYIGNETCTARISKRQTLYHSDNHGWYDAYDIDRISGSSPMQGEGLPRTCFER